MGDVYQATDGKLGRSVAVKFLPEAFAREVDRVARFEREARVLASLNHPNIAAIYGLEEANERKFLVMELAPGETLAARIARGAIPLDESLAIAKQIADALEAAHEKGIIHRDLKPANITVTAEGNVKVLDFGLAKAMAGSNAGETGSDASNANMSNSPTMISAGSLPGVILGTAAYMAPEQAKGRTLDKRVDVWAFGAVLYEMLTGRRCFEGEDVSDTLAAVLRAEPAWNALPSATPAAIRRLLRRCLEKDVRARLSDMAMVRIELRESETEPQDVLPAGTVVPPPRPSMFRRLAPVASVIIASLLTVYARPYPGPGNEVTISVGGGQEPVWAPSGRELFYRHDGKLLSVKLEETAASLTVSTPARVFDDPYRLDTTGAAGGVANYDISPSGQRFVMVEEAQARRTEPVRLQVILNWVEELKQRVPVNK
jgi:serine/threonine protein kinase